MKKIVFRSVSMLVVILYMVFFFPSYLGVISDYFSLKKETDKIFTEMTVLADTLITAKDVDTIIKNSGSTVSLCTVSDSDNVSSIKEYDGSELPPSKSRILEYTIIPEKDNSYLFGYLSSYQLSYSGIRVNENGEVVLRIFCN